MKSPKQIYARVKEDLKSYFDTGSINDMMFADYTNFILSKLGKSVLKKRQAPVIIKNYEGFLPPGFKYIKEVWLCESTFLSYRNASSEYTQIMTRIGSPDVSCSICSECENPNTIKAIYKTTGETLYTFNSTRPLYPATHSTIQYCSSDCVMNTYIDSQDVYEINSNKIYIKYSTGLLSIKYYESQKDEDGYPLIPEDQELVEKCIESYIKYKLFEQLFNQCNDETFNQLQVKYKMYEDKYYIDLTNAETYIKKQDVYRIAKSINKTKNRFNKFRWM